MRCKALLFALTCCAALGMTTAPAAAVSGSLDPAPERETGAADVPADPALEREIAEATGVNNVTVSFDEELSMYRYAFEDGAEFLASEALGAEKLKVSQLWIASETGDIEIRITLDGEPFAYSPTVVLDVTGIYVIEVSHVLSAGDRAGEKLTVRYQVEIAADETGGTEIIFPTNAVEESRMVFSYENGELVYSFGADVSVASNVLDGETVNFPVKLTVSDSLICSATKDGAVCSLPRNGIIDEDGVYRLVFTNYADTGVTQIVELGFRVYRNAASQLGIYHPPTGYSLESVLYNGEELPHSADLCVLDRDGAYTVAYGNGELSRSVTLERDTVPPVIYLNGGSGVFFNEPVTVTADTPCTFKVYKNGMEAGSDTTLSAAGIYTVTAEDEAGNVSEIRLEIDATSAVNPMNVIIGIAALGAAAVIYFIVKKNQKPVVR